MDDRVSGFYIKSVAGGLCDCDGGGTKCGRWNPTTEQMKVLTDLFRTGLHTPSTEQIQRISTQLSFYGKIESKNVFYWFQNHKARERQKRRKVSAGGDDDWREKIVRPDPVYKIVSSIVKDFSGVIDKADDQDQERVIKTLPLFPVNSLDEIPQPENLLGVYNANEFLPYAFRTTTEDINPPPLNLRLSSFI